MKRIAILDTETNGLEPGKHQVIECAVILYDLELATPLESYSRLLYAKHNDAFEINQIPLAALPAAPTQNPNGEWVKFENMASHADAFVAHNAQFDRRFVPTWISEKKPWVCSENDIEWPRGKSGSTLVKLALAHNLGVVSAHRALTDCDTLARLFTRAAELGVNLVKLIEDAMLPKVRLQALVPFDRKDEAKDAGFRWESDKKQWVKDVRADLPRNFKFPVREARV